MVYQINYIERFLITIDTKSTNLEVAQSDVGIVCSQQQVTDLAWHPEESGLLAVGSDDRSLNF